MARGLEARLIIYGWPAILHSFLVTVAALKDECYFREPLKLLCIVRLPPRGQWEARGDGRRMEIRNRLGQGPKAETELKSINETV